MIRRLRTNSPLMDRLLLVRSNRGTGTLLHGSRGQRRGRGAGVQQAPQCNRYACRWGWLPKMGPHRFEGKKAAGYLHQRKRPLLAHPLVEVAAGEGVQAVGDLGGAVVRHPRAFLMRNHALPQCLLRKWQNTTIQHYNICNDRRYYSIIIIII